MLTPSPKMSPSSTTVALMDADAPLDAVFRNRRRVALDHVRLHFAGATQRVDGAGEFDQQTVTGGLDDPPVMGGDLRIDQLAADRLEPRQRPLLVRSDQPRVARHIGGKDRGETAGCSHSSGKPARRRPRLIVLSASAR